MIGECGFTCGDEIVEFGPLPRSTLHFFDAHKTGDAFQGEADLAGHKGAEASQPQIVAVPFFEELLRRVEGVQR